MGGYNVRVVGYYKEQLRFFDRIGFQFFKIDKPFEELERGGLKEYYNLDELPEDFLPNEIHESISLSDIKKMHDASVKNQVYLEDMIDEMTTFAQKYNIELAQLQEFVLNFANKYYAKHFIQTYSANSDIDFRKGDKTTFSGKGNIGLE